MFIFKIVQERINFPFWFHFLFCSCFGSLLLLLSEEKVPFPAGSVPAETASFSFCFNHSSYRSALPQAHAGPSFFLSVSAIKYWFYSYFIKQFWYFNYLYIYTSFGMIKIKLQPHLNQSLPIRIFLSLQAIKFS